MPTGVSLHIGLNRVDPGHYAGWDGQLNACENDARSMRAVAATFGYESTLLLTAEATASRVTEAIRQSARALRAGDIFFLTYSGHGGQVPDVNGDEDDGNDETWVLYDRMLIDDELYGLWSEFQPGVRVVMLSDSCHSGTVARAPLFADLSNIAPLREAYHLEAHPRFRAIPPDIQAETYGQHQVVYDALQHSHSAGDRAAIAASILLMSGCQDNQTSADGERNGLFTATLLSVWNGGRFQGRYYGLWKEIVRRMPATQTPNYYTVGLPNPAFEAESPFTILNQRPSPVPAVQPSDEMPSARLYRKEFGAMRIIIEDTAYSASSEAAASRSFGGPPASRGIPVLKSGKITFVMPEGDDKDTDTSVSVSVTVKFNSQFDLTLASRYNFAGNDTWEDTGGKEYPYGLDVAGGTPLTAITSDVHTSITINPVGNDTVKFGYRLELVFDDDDPNTAPTVLKQERSGITLSQDSRTYVS